ncbi:MAG: FAD-dependent oxidoreductase [Roseibium sp.]|nr:FAD-dependent oxidoreductase [Roseibium sp.]
MIIGGGLSGLALAERLQAKGADYMLVEARDRFGGRILTEHYGEEYFDLGPAWFWPGQPRIAAMIKRLGLEKFDQFSEGQLIYEDEAGRVQRGVGYASMAGSWRLEGGLDALTGVLAGRVPDTRKRLNAKVVSLTRGKVGITAELATGERLFARQVVLALPPRLAAELRFTPSLPEATVRAMRGIPTWMAGQAKAIAIYNTPFWREEGLSGDAMSRVGPMVEIHDASPTDGSSFALFGFIGVAPEHRQDMGTLRYQLMRQLVRLFGEKAAEPVSLLIKDWAFDQHTSTLADKAPLYAHPVYGLPRAMAELWGGTLLFGGTEVAARFGGFIEGALESAESVINTLEHMVAGRENVD